MGGTERTAAMGAGTAFAAGAGSGHAPAAAASPCRRRRALCLLEQHFVPHQLFTQHVFPAAGHSAGTGTAGNGGQLKQQRKSTPPGSPS